MRYPFLPALLCCLMACGEQKPSPPSAGTRTDTATVKQPYFPVLDFLKSEIAYVDSLPVGIRKYTPGGRDTSYSYIKPDEFHRLAAEFTAPELADSFFNKNYHETSFMDQSSNAATFFYKPDNDALPVQRVDVMTTKGDVYDKIKNIYIQKNYRSGDTLFIKKLTWRPQKSLQIITERSTRGSAPMTSVVNVVWDNSEEQP